jgi:hypothetical protein
MHMLISVVSVKRLVSETGNVFEKQAYSLPAELT